MGCCITAGLFCFAAVLVVLVAPCDVSLRVIEPRLRRCEVAMQLDFFIAQVSEPCCCRCETPWQVVVHPLGLSVLLDAVPSLLDAT